LLIVGQSPNHNDVPYTLHSKQEAWHDATHYEFLRRGPESLRDKQYHPYYGKLVAFVRQFDVRLGVWWEVEQSGEKLLVEFCDALPLATIPRTKDFEKVCKQKDQTCPVRAECKAILQDVVQYYQPRVVLGNGWLPSSLLKELNVDQADPNTSTPTFISRLNPKMQIHLSGFMLNGMDEFSQARLLQEMKCHWPFV
jgi:hypothetical protein